MGKLLLFLIGDLCVCVCHYFMFAVVLTFPFACLFFWYLVFFAGICEPAARAWTGMVQGK